MVSNQTTRQTLTAKKTNHPNETVEIEVSLDRALNHLHVEDHVQDHCEEDQGPDQPTVGGQDLDRLVEDRALDHTRHQEEDVGIPDHLHVDLIVRVRGLVLLAEDRVVVGEEVTLVPGHEHHRVEGKINFI